MMKSIAKFVLGLVKATAVFIALFVPFVMPLLHIDSGEQSDQKALADYQRDYVLVLIGYSEIAGIGHSKTYAGLPKAAKIPRVVILSRYSDGRVEVETLVWPFVVFGAFFIYGWYVILGFLWERGARWRKKLMTERKQK